MAECVFCDIGRGVIASEILYDDDTTYVIRDIQPVAPVHLLVLPYEHVTSLSGHEGLVGHMFAVAGEMARRQGVTSSGFRLVINHGDDAGQALVHLHLHLLGGARLGPLG